LLVYIAEAHANDVWPLGKHVDLPSHKTFEDRKKAAMLLQDKFGCKIPMLLDTMEDKFDEEFAVWPERFFVLQSEKMLRVFYPDSEFGFDSTTMLETLEGIANGLQKTN